MSGQRKQNKPGRGWVHVYGGLWDHAPTRTQLHVVNGLLRTNGGSLVSAKLWPNPTDFERCIRIAGGNRKRGAMVWAMEFIEYQQKMIDEQKSHEATHMPWML